MNSTEERASTPEFTFSDDGGRPILKRGSIRPKFRPNDEVWFLVQGQRTGPFLVSEVAEGGWYRLCDQQQVAVNNSQWVKESALELYDPFE